MWIRKRTRKLKNGSESITFQAVESFRVGSKIKQKIISLGHYSDPNELLEFELKGLEAYRKRLEIPLSEYKQAKEVYGLGVIAVPMTLKQAEKKRAEILEFHRRKGKGVAQLETVVSKLKFKKT
jgi:hypothetical protein